MHLLRTIDDARALKARLVPGGARLVVIAPRLIGAETASAALQLGAQVTLCRPDRPADRSRGGPGTGALPARPAPEHGIAVHTAGGLGEIGRTGDTVTVVLTTGEELPADAVLVGIGSIRRPNSRRGRGTRGGRRSARGRALRTRANRRCSQPGRRARRDSDGTLHRREEHWEASTTERTRDVAARVLGQNPHPSARVGFWSERHGIHVQGVGSMTAEGRDRDPAAPDDATRPRWCPVRGQHPGRSRVHRRRPAVRGRAHHHRPALFRWIRPLWPIRP
ncbi:FAD-dependent oxidoreductase [Rhodococcus hoagii]|nr:FAD-dependent oxidoreductase [Prescottella equi]NKZ87524.1 FAD-dependent oxidoreductase [Prescottella equi]